MNRNRPLRPFLPLLLLTAAVGCVKSAAVGAEPVLWSCPVADAAAAAADFCPDIGGALEAGLRSRDPDRTVSASVAGPGSDPAALNLVVELVSASDRSLSARLLWQAPHTAGEEAGTSGDVIALKLQRDYLAAEDRAFRARHSTLCRNLVHLHGRRDGQGQSQLFPQIVRQVQNVIKAGGTA